MARKSATQVKAVKKEEKTEEQKWAEMRDVFDTAKFTYEETIRVQIKNAGRVDNYLNIRELMQKMDIKPSIMDVKELVDLSIATYKQVAEIAKTFKFEDFIKEEAVDYFEEIMPKVDEIRFEMDEVRACIRYLSVSSYGNKLIQMHALMQQELAARGLKPVMEDE